MRGLQAVIIGFILVGLFSFSLINFAINSSEDNPSNQSILNDSSIAEYRANLTTTFGEYGSSTNDSQESFSASTLVPSAFVVPLEAVTGIWKSMVKFPKLIFDMSIDVINKNIFGASSEFRIVFTIISALVVVIIFMYVYQWIKTGVPS